MSGLLFRLMSIIVLLSASAAQGEVITNEAHGFSLSRPDGWHNLSFEDYRNNIDQEDIPQREKDRIKKDTTPALIFIAKWKEPYKGINSTFTMRHRSLPTSDLVDAKATLNTIIQKSLPEMGKALLVVPPTDVKLGEVRGAYLRYERDVSLVYGRFQTANEIWLFAREKSLYLIQIGVDRNNNSGELNKLRSMIESIHFTR